MKIDNIDIQNVLRSINLLYDADTPERIAHFQPTSKAIVLINSILGLTEDKSFFISAPYGSGKSLTATFVLQTIENNQSASTVLKRIISKVEPLSPDLSKELKKRITTKKHGLVIALQGYQKDLPIALANSINASIQRINDITITKFAPDLTNVQTVLSDLDCFIKNNGIIDKCAIIWDEFGRHIETLISEGNAGKMDELQIIAEYASRCYDYTLTFTVMLHHSLMNYAGKVPQSIKHEWKKIEGRFATIQYVDNSKEVYQLIASVIGNFERKEINVTKKLVQDLKKHNVYEDFSNEELSVLLEKCSPISPIAIFLLPRLASRIAQHERTIFTFINSMNLQQTITTEDLFDYFSTTMSTDTTIGGTYHQWLEAQSAISKVEDKDEVYAIKTACLLGIGISGERSRIKIDFLELALKGFKSSGYTETIASLIDRKLFLYRKMTDSISIWHGTDIDLHGKLQELKTRKMQGFDPFETLREQLIGNYWKPLEYNSRYKIQRYFTGSYVSVSDLSEIIDSKNKEYLPNESDGHIFYLLPTNEEELKKSEEIANTFKHNQIIISLPDKPVEFYDICLEVICFNEMIQDHTLIAEDPLIVKELQQLSDDAIEYLNKVISIATEPNTKGPDYYYKGEKKIAKSSRELRELLSNVMKKVYPKTPVFNNEMINRKNPRKQLVNARKKLIFGILDRAGQKDLGLEGFTPDVSMFRTILLNNNLYQCKNNTIWYFASENDIEDKNLKSTWILFKDFLQQPGDYKKITDLLDKLKKPPIGIRDGVIPILLSAALRAYPSAISFFDEKGNYLPDILPSTIEDICSKPENYSISVIELSNTRKHLLNKMYKLFNNNETVSKTEQDLVRKTYDAIENWKVNLPNASLITRRISKQSQEFQNIITRLNDPIYTFFSKIPTLYNETEVSKIIEKMKKTKEELENVTTEYYQACAKSLYSAIQLQFTSVNDLTKDFYNWYNLIPTETTSKLKDGTAKAFLNRMKIIYDNSENLMDSISALLIGKQIKKWDDSSIASFDRSIHELIHTIDQVIFQEFEGTIDPKLQENIIRLAELRIKSIHEKTLAIVGKEKAKKVLENIIKGA